MDYGDGWGCAALFHDRPHRTLLLAELRVCVIVGSGHPLLVEMDSLLVLGDGYFDMATALEVASDVKAKVQEVKKLLGQRRVSQVECDDDNVKR